ncbi:hypothetical protein ACPEEZ_09630 [Frigoribacterium sp. 2-23]|uniref:hypothetical protein n=1 Tax=Frigoribacterium sp. 2-23 TaxID=3415006 RepID=UPI003C6FB983
MSLHRASSGRRRATTARPAGRRHGLVARVAVVTALVVAMVGGGTTAGWALWSASASKTLSMTFGRMAPVTKGLDALLTTYASTSSVVTAPVTLSNTGTITGNYTFATTVVRGASADAVSLASRITVAYWPQTTAACTASTATPSSAVTGTWASMPSVTGVLAAGASVVWCARTAPTSDAPAKATVNPIFALTLASTTGSWTTSTEKRDVYQNTSFSTTTTAYCTNDNEWGVRLTYDASRFSKETYYAAFVNGVRVAKDEQGYYNSFYVAASDYSKQAVPDGRVLTEVRVLDSARQPTSTVVSSGYVVFAKHATSDARTVNCA